MITVRYSFFVEVQMPAGHGADERFVDVDFETDDVDQACELADRALINPFMNILPANVIPGTLQFVTLS